MNVRKILAKLKAEREQIEEAIVSLEKLALGRGRPPGSKNKVQATTTAPKEHAGEATAGAAEDQRRD